MCHYLHGYSDIRYPYLFFEYESRFDQIISDPISPPPGMDPCEQLFQVAVLENFGILFCNFSVTIEVSLIKVILS